MKLTPEQEAFVEAIRDFAARERFDEPAQDGHSAKVAARMGELGWYGLQIPEEYGGSGGSFLDATLFLEETARGRIPVAAYGVTLIVVGALNRFGSEEQKRELFRRVVGGGTLAIAMSEPEAGSDVANLKTRARRENGEYVLDGSKMWCSYAHAASHILIVCRTGPGQRHEDMSMIMVPREAQGMTITPIPTLGGEETNEIHLDGVRVPEGALLGRAGGGWTQLMAGLNYERTILAATALASPNAPSTTPWPTPRNAASSVVLSAPSRLCRTGSRSWPPRSPRCDCSCAGWPRSPTRIRAGCCPARPRWRSWRRPSWPSAAPWRECRPWAATARPPHSQWSATSAPRWWARSTAARRRSRRTSSPGR